MSRWIVVTLGGALRERSRRSHHRDTRWHSNGVAGGHTTSGRVALRNLIAWVAHRRYSGCSSGRVVLSSRVMRLLRIACWDTTWRRVLTTWVLLWILRRECWCSGVYLFHFDH